MLIKKIFLFLSVFTVVLNTSCKKNYHCECTNSNGTYDAGEIETTKSKAKKHCESLSGASTTCKVK